MTVKSILTPQRDDASIGSRKHCADRIRAALGDVLMQAMVRTPSCRVGLEEYWMTVDQAVVVLTGFLVSMSGIQGTMLWAILTWQSISKHARWSLLPWSVASGSPRDTDQSL